MPRTLHFFSYETAILWRYFDGVSNAVAARLTHGSTPNEENLTWLLCELLDDSSTGFHVLPYPLKLAQEDLKKSDLGIAIDVEFKTHEHSKRIESKYSGSDLGIVFNVHHPVLGNSRRAILIQAKKLFPSSRQKAYSLAARYGSYDPEQARLLTDLQTRFDVDRSIYYLLYNPQMPAFAENDQKVMRSYHAAEPTGPDADEYKLRHHGLDLSIGGVGLRTPSAIFDAEDGIREWRQTQPALRVSKLDHMIAIAKNAPLPTLSECFKFRLEHLGWQPLPPFSPFAGLLLLGLGSDYFGSSNSDWVRLAEGQPVPMPPAKVNQQDESPATSDLSQAPSPRHTLTVTLRSTLPDVDQN